MPTYNPVAAKEIDEERKDARSLARDACIERMMQHLEDARDPDLTLEVLHEECFDHGLADALLRMYRAGGGVEHVMSVIQSIEAGFFSYAEREADQ